VTGTAQLRLQDGAQRRSDRGRHLTAGGLLGRVGRRGPVVHAAAEAVDDRSLAAGGNPGRGELCVQSGRDLADAVAGSAAQQAEEQHPGQRDAERHADLLGGAEDPGPGPGLLDRDAGQDQVHHRRDHQAEPDTRHQQRREHLPAVDGRTVPVIGPDVTGESGRVDQGPGH
jgi:hypothetical protein